MAIIGTDGKSPIYDPEARWTIWSIDELWQGPTSAGSGKYVGRVKDYVRDPDTYETWKITYVDPDTLKPTLLAIKPSGMTTDLTEADLLFGVGVSSNLDTFRVFLNDSVIPYVLCIDSRFMPKGSMASYAKIFLGTDTSSKGEVISQVYDATGNFISENIPLETVALNSHTNYAVKVVKRCNTRKKHKDGERVTVVVYSDDGVMIERRQMLIENTDVVSSLENSMKYISEISLKSIWLSNTIADQIDYPLNIPMDALNMIGVVTYSDGSTLELPVDGGKFTMIGLDNRLSSVVGQPHNLVLRYALSPDESALVVTEGTGKYITKPYTIKTVNTNNSIAVKLFGYPVWQNENTGYTMKWFLLNLDRNVKFDVTAHVKWAETTGTFNPKNYGYLQRKAVSINLRDVSGTFIPFVHTQVLDIVLNRAASNSLDADWTVGTEASDSVPRFGFTVWGRKVGALVNFKATHLTYASWLKAYYEDTLPQVNTATETEAPKPTHFEVTYGNTSTVWPVESWNKDLSIGENVVPGGTAFIRFFRRTATQDLQLSYAAAMIKSY